MGVVKLSDATVAALTCPAERKDAMFFDAVLKGFGLRVTAKGSRVFLYQYRVGLTVRRQRLGEWPTTTTTQARKLAERQRGAVHAGADPVAARRVEQAVALAAENEAKRQKAVDALTVSVLIDQWRDGHLASRRPSYQSSASNRLRSAFAPGWRFRPWPSTRRPPSRRSTR